MAEERVFCLLRDSLEDAGLLCERVMKLQDPSGLIACKQAFLPRSKAERDEGWKQLIPYQLFRCRDRFLVFQRGGRVNESRLAGRFSVGIGGHINDMDLDRHASHLDTDSLMCAALRERHEELELSSNVQAEILGIINDDSDAVGKVHLGLVILCTVDAPEEVRLRRGAEDLDFKGWWHVVEIYEKKALFEPWSILALDLVDACKALG